MKKKFKQHSAVVIQDFISVTLIYGSVLTISSTTFAATSLENNHLDNSPASSSNAKIKADSTPKQNQSDAIKLSAITLQATTTENNEQISRQDIDRFGMTSASDLLRGIAGVQLGDSRNGGGLDVNIRGIQGQGRVAVTVDGSQQALDTYRGYGGTQQRSYIDPDLISQIHITKGVNSASSPVGGIGGTVAMTTLTTDDILLPNKNSGFRMTGEFLDNSIKPHYRSPIFNEAENLAIQPRANRGNFFTNSAKSGTAAYAARSEKVDVVAAYAHRKQGNYFAGRHGHDKYRIFDDQGNEQNSTALSYAPNEEILNSSSETESLLLKTTLRPKEDHDLELSYRYFDGQYGEIMPSDIFRTGTAGTQQYPLGEMKINTASARYQFDPKNNDLIHLNANVWWNNAKSNLLNGSFYAPKSQIYIADRAWVRLENERLGADVSNTFNFDSLYGRFKLNLGAAFQHENIAPQKSVHISEGDRHLNRILRDAHRSEFNMNIQLDYEPTDRLKLWAGAKFSSFNAKDRNRQHSPVKEIKKLKQIRAYREGEWGNSMFWFPDENGNYTDATDPRLNNGIVFSDTNNPFLGTHYNDYGAVGSEVYDEEELNIVTGFKAQAPFNAKDHAFSPSFGISYRSFEHTLLFASYTMGTRMPSLFDSTLGTQQVSPTVGLKPERARVLEAGISSQFDHLLFKDDTTNVKLVYFDNKIKNYINRYVDVNPMTWGAMVMSNADSYAVDGLEFSANYHHPRFFSDFSATYYFSTETCDADFAQKLRSTANMYQQTHHTPNCTNGSYAGSYTNTQNPPEFSAHLTLGQYFYNQRLTVGARASYISGPTEKLNQPWQTGTTTPQIEYKAVSLVDAFIQYKLNKNITFNTALQNITNRYYLDALSQSFMPSPGRTFKFGATLQF